jgi:hypothetical protein
MIFVSISSIGYLFVSAVSFVISNKQKKYIKKNGLKANKYLYLGIFNLGLCVAIYALRYSYARYKEINNIVVTKGAILRMILFIMIVLLSIKIIAGL